MAIEGENNFFELLKENTKEYKCYYENLFLTDDTESMYKSIVEHGTAKIIKDSLNHISTITLDQLMETKYKDFKANILKVDTDGFDFKVLRGAENYILENRPIIYFEWCKEDLNIQEEDELSFFEDLYNWGYKDIIVYDNFGNKLLALHSNDRTQMQYLANYTVNKDKIIYYYDILAVHEKSRLSYCDF